MYVCHCHHPALHIPCVRSLILTLTYITPHTQRHDDMIILLDDEPTTLPNAAPTPTGDSAAAAAAGASDELPTVINGSPCDEAEEVMDTPSAPQVPAEPEVVEAKPTSTNPTQALLRRKTCLADTSLHLVRSKSFTGTGGRDVLRAMLRANSTRERTMRAVRETSHSSASAWAEQRALTDQKLRIQRARAAQQQQQQLRLAQLQDTAANPFEPPPSAAAPAGPDSSEEGAAEAAAPGAVESGQDSTLLASQATAATAEFAVHSSDEDEDMPDAEGEGSQRLQRKAQPTQSEALLESSDDEGSRAVSAADAAAVAAAKAEAAKRRQEERERAEVAAGLGPKLAIGADGAIKGSKKTQSLASLFGAVAKKQAATGQPALSAAQAMQKKPARSTGRIGALLASGTSKKRAHADSNASDSEEGASPTKRTRRPGGADGSEADDEGEAESSSEEEESGPTEEELAAEAARKAKRDKDKAAGYRRMLLEEAKQSAAHKRSSVSQSP